MKLSNLISRAAVVLAACTLSPGAFADGHSPTWKLVGEESKVAFGSVKLDAVGESHRFNLLAGKVDNSGRASIEIALASVHTGIEIRDTRMKRHLFEGMMPGAILIAGIDPKVIVDLAPAATATIDVSGTLSLGSKDIAISAPMFLAKLSEDKILVSTDEMLMIGTETLGITEGVDKLMELAKLPSIGRVVPVTLRFIFEKD